MKGEPSAQPSLQTPHLNACQEQDPEQLYPICNNWNVEADTERAAPVEIHRKGKVHGVEEVVYPRKSLFQLGCEVG